MAIFESGISSKKIFQQPHSGSDIAIPLFVKKGLKDPDILIGVGWTKHAPNGHEYIKFKFNCLQTDAGKAVYIKAWGLKSEPNVFCLEVVSFPIIVTNPLVFPVGRYG